MTEAGLLAIPGRSIYFEQDYSGSKNLRQAHGDKFGALDVNTYAPIFSKQALFAQNTISTAYLLGKLIGTPATPAVFTNVSRGNLFGTVIETLLIKLTGPNTNPPDLDVHFFANTLGVSTTLGDNIYPIVGVADMIALAGVVQIRAASGHWTRTYAALNTTGYWAATLNPFLSFALNNLDPTKADMSYFVTMAQATYTFDPATVMEIQLTLRQG